MRVNIYSFIIFFSILFLASCGKNIDVTEGPIIKNDNPQELPHSVISGKVLGIHGEAVPNATIHVLHNKLDHTVKSNALGEYTIAMPLDFSGTHVQAEHSEYIAGTIAIVDLDHENIKHHIKLAKVGDTPFAVSNSAMLTDSLFTVSGQLLFNDGSPMQNSFVFLLDIATSFADVLTFTDNEGFYSFTFPAATDKTLGVYQPCGGILETVVDNLTIIDEDIDLGIYTSELDGNNASIVTGYVTDCNTGAYIPNGQVEIFLGAQKYTDYIQDGYYSIELPNCEGLDCYDITITSGFITDGVVEETCVNLPAGLIEADYELCGDPVLFEGVVRLKIGEDSLKYEFGEVELNETKMEMYVGGFNVEPDQTVFFAMNDYGIGTHEVVLAQVKEGESSIYTSFFEEEKLFIDIESIEPYVEGTIYGEVLGAGGAKVISGTFKILN